VLSDEDRVLGEFVELPEAEPVATFPAAALADDHAAFRPGRGVDVFHVLQEGHGEFDCGDVDFGVIADVDHLVPVVEHMSHLHRLRSEDPDARDG